MTEKTALDLLAERVRHLETLEEIMSNIHGWDGSAWRKLSLIWGYSGRWRQTITGTAVGAGKATAISTGLDAGYVYVVQALSLQHDAAAAKDCYILVTGDAVAATLVRDVAVTPLNTLPWTGELTLKSGDIITAEALAPGDGKHVYLHIWGYKMKIAA